MCTLTAKCSTCKRKAQHSNVPITISRRRGTHTSSGCDGRQDYAQQPGEPWRAECSLQHGQWLVLCGDFGWSQRRGASAGVYVLIDASTGKVLHQIILTKRCTRKIRGRTTIIRKGNYFGTSKGMEGEAFRRMLNWLDEKKLMPYFKVMVCDQDSSVLCQLREDPRTKHVTVVHDPLSHGAHMRTRKRGMQPGWPSSAVAWAVHVHITSACSALLGAP